ncbi:related to Pyranose 2-oxidase [Fusarium fujikuroi IMI 58289]|uniref:Pyranose 2-oxidase n=2 Tax=Fusarium fujikuroi TaxID=5127 RepID=S0EM16_GIBF5|nr:related to Pyranose 2-oxidase [Fusarium fujikuroi IMI 58289]KLO97898.1 Pyranose 2-oxidase [Fusarium fujikuroi]KLP08760.1 Pyranose 2-oxidase [Fusarium fujikuroi]CCT76068.1 related to Pyranose 2-oxidase [Fusarium fujikuroi IMI 58289]SCO13979.1 related to Pyranose 2-oxidase [Fusarium fujikuroi]SCO15341.1 related to Pyranose 2-oxidase [Fusarium fujikuroi]
MVHKPTPSPSSASDTFHLEKTDVLIVGSGPIGATFAHTLVKKGIKVTMIDIGQQETRRVGDHKKNSVAVQKDISLFTNTVKGELHPLSVPTNSARPVIEPASWSRRPTDSAYVLNGQNPEQKAYGNLPAAAATRVVGGMGSHWTCCTPRQHKGIERSDLFSDSEWNALYSRAEKLFKKTDDAFDDSVRQRLVKRVLTEAYPDREMKSMPLACKRKQGNKEYVEWSCTATILGELSTPEYFYKGEERLFDIRPNTQCDRLEVDALGQIHYAVINDLENNKEYYIEAKKYVVCAGAVLTPGILYKSKLKGKLPMLGHYLTEQPMAFCQVVLDRTLVNSVRDEEAVKTHTAAHENDPLPFPFNDPDPQVYFPVSEKYPWHTQIHRDAFGYGEVPSNIDQRLVVDLRWFGYMKPEYENCVTFSTETKDQFGMPQPIFNFILDEEAEERCKRMITDMIDVARKLGGFLPGAEPKYLAPGSALHICGTYRAGSTSADSVVNKNGKAWGVDNLVLGGCGVIPTQNACNPTLTAACFALAAADKIIEDLQVDQ